ncbi:AN1-type zinc finger protein 3 isoform X2 [Oryzias latipes]|uniref:AN1-type zinc finger protein 3 isoform X2 n=1 Tax=Oryzias latipes TaxID=8090 RepID=UPI0009D967B5|nr:AN1-type zinc finger protein 3 isoform X2 [Oryzias latipes]
MGDTSGRSEAALPPRCPCGFWGSSKTLNLCSKCFADVQKKQPEDDCTPPSPQGPTSSQPLTLPSTSAGEPIFSSLREASSPESGASPEKRLREGAGEDEGPRQKNRRRCFHCQSKLELVQQELGSCRCGFVFCMRHRLPEQHNCRFDHLGRGRRDAILKMVKLERKVGRSCQRIGEECS